MLLWVALLLAKPKPAEFPRRTRFTVVEYWLAAMVMSAALVLFIHPGWHLSSQAPSGMMAVLWGMGWIAGWLGPVTVAVFVLLIAHWFATSLYLDYRQAWWRWQHEQVEQSRTDEILPQLAESRSLGAKDAQWVARKLAQWLSTRARGEFNLALPASRLLVTAQLDNQSPTAHRTAYTTGHSTGHMTGHTTVHSHDESQQELSTVRLAITLAAAATSSPERAASAGSGTTPCVPEQLLIRIQLVAT